MNRLNYFNFKIFNGEILATNDTGRYMFMGREEFKQLLTEKFDYNPQLFERLKHNWFVTDVAPDIFAARIQEDMRRAKSHLFTATSLFIFVVTLRCNSRCIYCQAQSVGVEDTSCDMDLQTAQKGVELALSSPCPNITIEFQGGEPLLNYELIKEVIIYAEEKNNGEKKIQFTIVSNLALLTQEILDFLIEHNVNISTSLDGQRECHDKNRSFFGGRGTYEIVKENIKKIMGKGYQVGAIQTTTRYSLSHAREIVDEYINTGLDSIFIRPLTPLGFAENAWSDIGYEAEEFVEFYKQCLTYILDQNKKGKRISEGHCRIWLNKIIGGVQSNYMELRSPCGAAIGQVAITGNGDVYTCDEARMLSQMGNDVFLIGNVHTESYNDLMESEVTKTMCVASTLESLPQCCDCVYQPYCGVCPVVNLAMAGNIFARQAWNYRCKIYSGMLDVIFGVLQKNDSTEIEILKSWI